MKSAGYYARAAWRFPIFDIRSYHDPEGADGAYGLYSLNLLSPWIPFPQTLSGRLLVTTLPVMPGTNQWEGGAYLGVGMLVLCVIALPALKNQRANLQRHAVLFALLVAMQPFAVSQRIGVGAHEIVRIRLPDVLLHALSQFRGSGRFVWVAVYVLLAALLAAIVAPHDRRHVRIVLGVAAVLEIADMLPMQNDARAASASAGPSTINRDAWTRLTEGHARIFEFPSFECGDIFGRDVPGSKFREVEIDWIAATRNVPTNSAYLARFTKDCERERADATTNLHERGLLRIYRSTNEIGAFLQQHDADLERSVVCSNDIDLSTLR